MEAEQPDRKTKQSPEEIQQGDEKRVKLSSSASSTTTGNKRTINVFYLDCKLPLSFYPGTVTLELVALILKGLRLPMGSEAACTFLDEEGHLTALSSFMDDGASIFLKYEPSAAATTIAKTKPRRNNRPVSSSTSSDDSSDDSSTTTSSSEDDTTTTDNDDSTIDECSDEDDDDGEILEIKEVKQPKEPKETKTMGRTSELRYNIVDPYHQLAVIWLSLMSISGTAEQIINDTTGKLVTDDVTRLLFASVWRLFLADDIRRWDIVAGNNVVATDLLQRRLATINDQPYRCMSAGGITQGGQIYAWRLQFSGVTCKEMVGYFHIGVVFPDEHGLIQANPHTTLMPCVALASHSRCYDVIIDTRPSALPSMHLVDVPGRYLYRGMLQAGKLPRPDRPLRLAIWSKHPLQAQIVDFCRGGELSEGRRPTGMPYAVRTFAYNYTRVHDERGKMKS